MQGVKAINLDGSKTPSFLKASHAIGTVEFTFICKEWNGNNKLINKTKV